MTNENEIRSLSKPKKRKTFSELENNKRKIWNLKNTVNCILENGAYSEKNERVQTTKCFDNYNNEEQILVKSAWVYRKFLGIQMQNKLLEMLTEDKQFLFYFKANFPEEHKHLKELSKRGIN